MCCIVAGTAVYHLIKHGIIYFQGLATVFAITPGEEHSNCIVHSADERTIDFIIWPHRTINLPPTYISICIYLTVCALISYPEILHSVTSGAEWKMSAFYVPHIRQLIIYLYLNFLPFPHLQGQTPYALLRPFLLSQWRNNRGVGKWQKLSHCSSRAFCSFGFFSS